MSKKILIIDDDKDMINLLQLRLEQKGYQVISARDGTSGYELIEKENPDLIISDLLIPRLHGFELCKKVKENAQLKHIPIILMTAVYKKTSYKVQGKKYGADDYIQKPFEFPDLLSKVEKLISPTSSDQS
jgi:DNA-binding response OmpR family regulator